MGNDSMTGWRRSRIGEVKTETELGREERESVKGRERGQRRERNTDRGCNGAAEK